MEGAAPLAVQAIVEGRHHLVLPVGTGVDVDQRPQAVEPERSQAGLGERAEVPARPLDEQQLGRRLGDGVVDKGLARSVAAGVVSVPPVAPEAV